MEMNHDREDFLARSKEHVSYLSSQSDATVVAGTADGDYFHSVLIDGVRFSAGFFLCGLCIERVGGGIVELGNACEIKRSTPTANWSIWRYGHDERINLDGLSLGAIHALGYQFGIAVNPAAEEYVAWISEGRKYLGTGGWYLFYLSPAFESLCAYAKRHPRRIKTLQRGGPCLGDWQSAAISGEYMI